MKSASTKPYSGLLAEPIPKWTTLSRPSDEEVDALLEAKGRHYLLISISILLKRLRAAPSWQFHGQSSPLNSPGSLCRASRRAPVGPGRPAKRKFDVVMLFMYVGLLKRRDGLSVRGAIQA